MFVSRDVQQWIGEMQEFLRYSYGLYHEYLLKDGASVQDAITMALRSSVPHRTGHINKVLRDVNGCLFLTADS